MASLLFWVSEKSKPSCATYRIFECYLMKEYKEYYSLPAPPEEVYTALTNPFTLELWTGAKAIMSTEPGSDFSLMDDSISGRNIEFEENKRIVQEWNFGDQEEPSTVTIKLYPKGNGTSVHLVHKNIPGSDFEDICEGWDDAYFGSLQEFFED